jgi:tetratricopeptide (TPR) repeat protein
MKDVSAAALPPNQRAQYLWSLAQILMASGDVEEANHVWSELDNFADRVPDPYVRSWQVNGMANRMHMSGDLEGSLALSDEFVARSRDLGIELWGQFIAGLPRTFPLEALGRYEELQTTFPLWRTLPYGEGAVAGYMATIGQTDEARKEIKRLISERRIGEPDSWAEDVTLSALLDAAVRVGDADAAAILYGSLKGGYEEWYAFGAYAVARLMGEAQRLLGDPEKTREHFETAINVGTKVGDRPETARSHFALARLLFEHFPNEKAEAAEHLNFATREFQAMKMKPSLEDAMRLKLQFQGITSTDINTSIDTVARGVMADKPDLRPQAAPDGTVTIMFSDIEGSTEKTERLGDEAWMQVLREHNSIVRDQINAHAGFEVKSEGDGFMVAFQSARKALEWTSSAAT